jgi:hypothetical protein
MWISSERSVVRARWAVGVVATLGLAVAGRVQAQSWSAPVNLGHAVNTEYSEDLPHLSEDGLDLYFISDRPEGSFGKFDIWVSHRESPHHSWGAPRNLGWRINSGENERGPCLSSDGHYLFFSSDRNPAKSQDLFASYREWRGLMLGWGPWQTPVNLGPGVNTKDPDFGAALLKNGPTGVATLLFGRRRDFGQADIYQSELDASGWFVKGVVVQELSTEQDDLRPTVRPDGLELFFNSNRTDSVPRPDQTLSNDLWVSRRESIASPWSTPRNVGPDINTEFEEQYPTISADGTTLIFSSNRESAKNDLYISTRLDDPHTLP